MMVVTREEGGGSGERGLGAEAEGEGEEVMGERGHLRRREGK